MLRVIQEIRPRWVVGENVAGIVTLALDQVLSDLEGIGYTCQAVIIPACAVDAPHRRDRCAILAHSMCIGNAVVPQQFYPIFEAIAARRCADVIVAFAQSLI
jgi:hypothetical protein